MSNIEEEKQQKATIIPQESQTTDIVIKQPLDLNVQAEEIINQLAETTDTDKVNELTALFNLNQKKKAMARMNKLNELQEIVVDEAIARFSKKPDQLDNNTLVNVIKTTQTAIDQNNRQINEQPNTPFIQINQQKNEINVGNEEGLSKESRDKVKNAVATILARFSAENNKQNTDDDSQEIIDIQTESETQKND